MSTTHNCPDCSAPFTVHSLLSHYYVCTKCKSLLQKNKGGWAKDATANGVYIEKIASAFWIGDSINIKGGDYTIISLAGYKGNYFEWDEDDGKYLGADNYRFIEVGLQDAKGFFATMIEDVDGFTISQRVIPPRSCIPEETSKGDVAFFELKGSGKKLEQGNYKPTSFVGEFSYKPDVEETTYYADIRTNEPNRKGIISVEWQLNNRVPHSVEFFEDTPQEFGGLGAVIKDEVMLERAKPLVWAKNSVFLFFALAMAFLVMAAIMKVSSENLIFKETFSYGLYEGFRKDSVVTQEFELGDVGAMYELKLTNAPGTSADQTLDVVIDVVDANNKIVNSFDTDFFIETGYDDEGAWTESEKEATLLLRLDQGGVYRLLITCANTSIANNSISGNLDVKLNKTHVLRYYIFGFGICLLLGFICMQLEAWYMYKYFKKSVGFFSTEHAQVFWGVVGVIIIILLFSYL